MGRKRKQIFWSAAWGGCITLACILLVSNNAAGQSSKLSKDLQSLPSATPVNVVIQYYNSQTSTDTNYAKSVGAAVGKGLGLINGYGFSNMSPTTAAKLVSLDANVKYISLDRKPQMASTSSH